MEAGRHRRYTTRDLQALQHMQSLVAAGTPPAMAAATVRAAQQSAPQTSDSADQLMVPYDWRALVTVVSTAPRRVDTATAVDLLQDAFEQHGVVRTWQQLCLPAMAAISEPSADDAECIEAEHLLSWAIQASLHQAVPVAPPRENQAAAVLLACPAGEQHTLAMEAVRAPLTEIGTASRVLGANVPTDALVSAAARVEISAALLWAQTSRTARVGALRALRAHLDTLVAAGPGWDPERLPNGVQQATNLPDAIDLLTRGHQ